MQMPHLQGAMTLATCRGTTDGSCRFALPAPAAEQNVLKAIVEQSGWQSFIMEKTGGRVRTHDALRVGVSACANGCSRPHIMDFGIIRARKPQVDETKCVSCGLCTRACPDEAICSILSAPASIDYRRCLSCGLCEQACPGGALSAKSQGYRVLLGGRLGRRPKLARELPGIWTLDESMGILQGMLESIMSNHRPVKRHAYAIDAWLQHKSSQCA